MKTEGWPPPPRSGDRHEHAPVRRDGRYELVRLRVVRLWGRDVLVDDQHRVHCHGCLELIPADDLARPDNGHPVGLPFRHDGQLTPAHDEAS